MAELAEVVEHIEEDFPFSILKDLNHNGIEMNPSQGCKMDCDNCELRLGKKHNFANNIIEFFQCRSQSQHNFILKKVVIAKVAKIIISKIFLKNWSIEA